MFFYQVMINNGFTPDKEDYEFCTKVENMVIPTEGFFGISAATGGLAGITLLLFYLGMSPSGFFGPNPIDF